MRYASLCPDPHAHAVELILSLASAFCLTYQTRVGLNVEPLCSITVLGSVLVQFSNLTWLIATCVVTPSRQAAAIILPLLLLDGLTGGL